MSQPLGLSHHCLLARLRPPHDGGAAGVGDGLRVTYSKQLWLTSMARHQGWHAGLKNKLSHWHPSRGGKCMHRVQTGSWLCGIPTHLSLQGVKAWPLMQQPRRKYDGGPHCQNAMAAALPSHSCMKAHMRAHMLPAGATIQLAERSTAARLCSGSLRCTCKLGGHNTLHACIVSPGRSHLTTSRRSP